MALSFAAKTSTPGGAGYNDRPSLTRELIPLSCPLAAPSRRALVPVAHYSAGAACRTFCGCGEVGDAESHRSNPVVNLAVLGMAPASPALATSQTTETTQSLREAA